MLRAHTLTMRLEQLLKQVREGPSRLAPVRSMSRSGVLGHYGQVYERMGYIDALLRMAGEERSSAWARGRLLGLSAKAFARRAIMGW